MKTEIEHLQGKYAVDEHMTKMEKEKHIEDRCCSDCIKYSCNYIITNGKKGHICTCSCHKEVKNLEENKK